jgi:hypothetical protein
MTDAAIPAAVSICNLDERLANLILLSLLNKVLTGRKNLSKNIVLAHPNRSPSHASNEMAPAVWVHWK